MTDKKKAWLRFRSTLRQRGMRVSRQGVLRFAVTVGALLIAASADGQLVPRYHDDFSADLAAWEVMGGTWTIQDGHLRGYYGIGCGSVWCPQGDLLLKDDFQPRTEDWRMEVDFTYTYTPGSTHAQAFATFVVWFDEMRKEQYTVGWAGWGWGGDPLDSIYYDRQHWKPWTHAGEGFTAVSWAPKAWNRAALEKRGELYSLYLNDKLVHTFEGSTFQGVPRLGLHVYGARLLDNFTLFEIPALLEVEVDIKPGSYPNSINLGSKGVVPVAILSSQQFDATTVDETTVELAGAGVAIRGKNHYLAHVEDVNGDGLPDLVCHVETENLSPETFQDGCAQLTGQTSNGQQIEGWDEITVVPPE